MSEETKQVEYNQDYEIKFAFVYDVNGKKLIPHAYWVDYLLAHLNWEEPRPQKKGELLERAGIPSSFYYEYMVNNSNFWRWLNAQMKHLAPMLCMDFATGIVRIALEMRRLGEAGDKEAARVYDIYCRNYAPLLQVTEYLTKKDGTPEGGIDDARLEKFLQEISAGA